MNKHNISRLVCVLLACLMLLPVVACGKSEDQGTTTTTAAGGEATTTVGGEGEATTEATENTDINGYLKDDLDPSLNFQNEEFTLLYWSDREHEEFYAENQTGDLVNDAIYTRNQMVEERLGIKFAYVTEWISKKFKISEADLKNIIESGYFRYCREIVFDNCEDCNVERFLALAQSQGSLQTILKLAPELIEKDYLTFQKSIYKIFDKGMDKASFCYRMRIGVK